MIGWGGGGVGGERHQTQEEGEDDGVGVILPFAREYVYVHIYINT